MPRILSTHFHHLLLALTAAIPALAFAESIDERDAFFEWIRMEKEIVAERTNWMRDRELLLQEIELLRQELAAVDEEIERAEDTATRTEKRRREQVAQRDVFIDAGEALRRHLRAETAHLLRMQETLPPSLRDETESLFRRLAQFAADPDSSIGEGIQTLIAVLHRLQRFDQGVTVETRLLDLPGGDRREVDAIYLGLAIGYFVDSEGRRAGFGQADGESWDWTTRDDLAPEVRRLIEVAQQQTEPAFIPTYLRLKTPRQRDLPTPE